MQQPNSNKANIIIVAAFSTQVDIRQNAGGTHARRTLYIYTHSILAVLAVSDNCSPL
jgi:accessory gene regulator protein AgrB